MRALVLACVALLACVAPLAAPPVAAAASAEVAALQVALRARGHYAGPVDGLHGPGTAAAIRAAQRRAGIGVDGIAGPLTRRALGRLGRPPYGSRVLRAPAVGWDVSMLQFLLAFRGFPSGPFDGVLGARTTGAIVRFQASRGLVRDGIAGPATQAAARSAARRVPIPLRRPMPYRATDRFGPRGGRFHTGLDFPAPAGTPVRAAAYGCVKYAGNAGDGYGIVVTLGHGSGLTTAYAHLSRAAVRPGACVGTGAVIGYVGSTGYSTGPHLHFEARINGAAVDPAPALVG